MVLQPLQLFLACLAALVPLARGQCDSYIIVGAGMSGLSAAKRLVDRGANAANITILEARSRTGGRVYTDTTSLGSGVKVDTGASWIHGGGSSNPIRGLADAYGVATVADPDEVAARWYANGNMYTDAAVSSESRKVESMASDAASNADDSSVSLRTMAGQLEAGATLELMRAGVEFDTASPDSQISAYRAVNAGLEFSGPELIFADGYSQIPDGLKQRLQTAGVVFRLDSVVTAVEYGTGKCAGVAVTVSGGTVYRAGAAVVTVPLGVLKAGSVTFSPALPDNMQQAINRIQMGKNGKAFARFSSDFWSSEIGASSFVFAVDIPSVTDSTRGRHWQFFNYKKHIGVPVLMSFMSGEYAAAAESKTDAEVKADFMQSLRIAFPNAPEPTHFMRTTWGSDPYSMGSYSVWAGTSYQDGDYSILSTAASPCLALGGEHTEPSYFSSVHGAYLSGQHAANQVFDGIASASLARRSQHGLTLATLGSLLALGLSPIFA